jgi:ParB family chromosome partitioning protein
MSDDAPKPLRRPSGLGRGLSALMGDVAREQPVQGTTPPGVQTVPVASIRPHPGQPRRHFDDAALDELAASIAARGLIQPILVRPHAGGVVP